jgi:hypothetical protein
MSFPVGLCPEHGLEQLELRQTCSGIALHPVLVFSCGGVYNTPSV